ncbi:MAG: TIGR04376 family protein [Cyanobacteriota bacterium]|nr:TIGR04376 family protein [Cyanobacteriota bacterium]
MGLFDDFSRFLETRLEEFLRDHPHLELQALEEQLREQQEDTLRLIADLQRQEKNIEQEILNIAQDIQRWHERVTKAEAAKRQDLAQAAKEREAALLRQGNQRWGQMQGIKQRIEQSKELYQQIKERRTEVAAKATEAAKTYTQAKQQPRETQAWNQSSNYSTPSSGFDPLEEKFQKWETEDELEQLKRQMKQ